MRIKVDDVKRGGKVTAEDSNESLVGINTQRRVNAQALYGEDAGYWLGLQDTIEKCKAAGLTCIVNIGGSSGGPAIPVPSNSPAPAPKATVATK